MTKRPTSHRCPQSLRRLRRGCRYQARRRRRVVHGRQWGDCRPRRRIGFGQNRLGDVDPAAVTQLRIAPNRRDPVRRQGHSEGQRSAIARHSRQKNFDHLSGADDDAQSAAHHREAGWRNHQVASKGFRPGDAHARDRTTDQGRHSRRRKTARSLSASAFRRPAAARDDRHRARQRARPADRRRADNRARRHDPGADPGAAQVSAKRNGHGDAAHHPRSRHRAAHGRPRLRHAERRDRRNRQCRRSLHVTQASLYAPSPRSRTQGQPAVDQSVCPGRCRDGRSQGLVSDQARFSAKNSRLREGRRWFVDEAASRRNAWRRRRVRFRQNDARSRNPAASIIEGPDRLRRQAHRRLDEQADAAAAQRDAGRLPGSLWFAVAAAHHRADHRRRAADPESGARRRSAPIPRRRGADRSRARPRARETATRTSSLADSGSVSRSRAQWC